MKKFPVYTAMAEQYNREFFDLFTFVILVWIYTVFASIHTIRALYLLYPVSWSITAVAEIAYFVWIFKKLKL